MYVAGVTDKRFSLKETIEITATFDRGGYFLFMRMSIIFIASPAMPIMTRQNVNNSIYPTICTPFPEGRNTPLIEGWTAYRMVTPYHYYKPNGNLCQQLFALFTPGFFGIR